MENGSLIHWKETYFNRWLLQIFNFFSDNYTNWKPQVERFEQNIYNELFVENNETFWHYENKSTWLVGNLKAILNADYSELTLVTLMTVTIIFIILYKSS